ncbi:MAG: glycosyltransferase, partial [Gammaproteobacteria bacterium]
MRIAIITDAWHPQINGVVRTLGKIIDWLTQQGHQVLVVEPSAFKTLPLPSYPEIRLSLFPGRKVAQMLHEFAPEAIHISTEGPLGLAARKYALSRELPFTTAYHTRFPEYVRERVPIPLSISYMWVRWFHNPAQRVMVSTESLRRELAGQGLKHLVIMSRGVDTDLFVPREHKNLLGGKQPAFLYLGRVAVEKNIEAFLSLDLPGKKHVIGDGPALHALRERYPSVRFHGYKTGKELARHLACADVMVFPSRTDTFGLVILEALACGVPVAAYPVQGPVEIIENGSSGFVSEDLEDRYWPAAEHFIAKDILKPHGVFWPTTADPLFGLVGATDVDVRNYCRSGQAYEVRTYSSFGTATSSSLSSRVRGTASKDSRTTFATTTCGSAFWKPC